MKSKHNSYFLNLICPAFVFGSFTGILTAGVITLYKLCAKYIVHFSEAGYHLLRENIIFLPAVITVLFGFALLFAVCYKKIPNLQGGGIPTSIGILRGIIRFDWLKNLIGVFFLSLSAFFIGVPLGTEGPSVQMGTAIGRGSIACLAKKHMAWDRYSMTGGACAGFSVATGAPISGILFGIEEAHQRISPMIIIVSATSVMFSYLTTQLIAPLLGVSETLFPEIQLTVLSVKDVWIPVVIGIAVGFFAVGFLKYYRLISTLISKKAKKIPHSIKIFTVFFLTLIAGLFSYSFVSTGHELILSLLDGKTAIYMLILLLLVRSTLTLASNGTRVTGGIFLPILALGAALSALLAECAENLLGFNEEYHMIILVLGIGACISGMMKMPLTAIVFSVEALSCHDNIFYVIVATATAFIITEIFDVKSINDSVLENNVKHLNRDKEMTVIDTFVTVKPGAFAVGKQIRDIFWPANLFVLSVKHSEKQDAQVDEHGGKAICEGDTLHVRYSTYDETQTRSELIAIVGEQEYIETEADII